MNEGVYGESRAERGRVSSCKKMDLVQRVFRDEDLDLVFRAAGITTAKVSEWGDQFMACGQADLKNQAADSRTNNSND